MRAIAAILIGLLTLLFVFVGFVFHLGFIKLLLLLAVGMTIAYKVKGNANITAAHAIGLAQGVHGTTRGHFGQQHGSVQSGPSIRHD